MHVHAIRDGVDAKFWLWPYVRPAYNDGFTARELRQLTEAIEHRQDDIKAAWENFFGKS